MKAPNFLKNVGILGILIMSLNCGKLQDLINRSSESNDFSDQTMCAALGINSPSDFESNNYSGTFDELDNDQDIFIDTSPEIENSYDGTNVITLNSASVVFDYEDSSVDGTELGGFASRWKIILIPYSEETANNIDDAIGSITYIQNSTVSDLRNNSKAIEIQLSGPFQSNGCEWGDTDDIGTQALTYTNYGIYDWDYFPNVDRVIGIIYEGDDGIQDDLIAKIDISKDDDTVTVTDEYGSTFVFTANTDVDM